MSTPEEQLDVSQPEVATQGNQPQEREQEQLSTPPGELNGADAKTSRKREREVSLEPATPQATTVDIDTESGADSKERRAPAKKNRTSAGALETTEEEAEDDIALSGSPPHETKIRQISQGVEDITWQNMKKDSTPEPEHKMEEDASTTQEQDATAAGIAETTPVEEPAEGQSQVAKADAQEDVQVPPLLRGENPPILNDTAGDLEDSGAAAGAEQPAGSHVPGAPEPPTAQVAPSESSSTPFPETQRTQSPRVPHHRRDSDSDQEKGLKRKLGDRTVSERLLPGETIPGLSGTPPLGTTKRPRDDPEADPNTREKKRPTPPPEEDEKETKAAPPPAPSSPPKFGGFMAYASTSSPFASVSGPSVFGSKRSSASPWSSAATQSSSSFSSASSSNSPFAAAVKDKDTAASSSSAPSAQKRTGFEAFASITSPFASAAKRPKSPPPPSSNSSVLGRSRSPSRHGTPARASNAFSAYAAGGAQGFAAASSKRRSGSTTPALGESSSASVLGGPAEGSVLDAGKDDDSEKDSGVSFGERLREAKDKEDEEASDEEKKLNLTEQEVHTGEEEEDTVYQVRGKLYTLSPQNQWKERGTGTLRLNVRREDGGGARLVMRKEAVYTVLLNATLFKGMRCFLAQDPRYIRFSVIEGATTTHYNLRVSSAKIAEELLEEINARIPSD
ncbi:hypothetical protein BV20DRAFT_974146 [Pilatotrama ljubarskyi]|nr:hypothetical protein BV20DRAFT_974146 [Pilatotrama ljubarskyi]